MRYKKQMVYVVDGARTPFLKASLKPNFLTAADLAVAACTPLLARQPFKPKDIDEVVAGCVGPSSNESNIGRMIALRVGCGHAVEGWTVQRNCASGLQALDSAAGDILKGTHDLVLAGGTECMSRAPLLYSREFTEWLVDLRARDLASKLKAALKFRPRFLKPIIALEQGLSDALVNLSMGQTAENLAYHFNISREEMDSYALQSHQRTIAAMEAKQLEEIVPLFDWQGNVVEFDTGVRSDSTLQKLATLKPAFDKPFGNVTAGNSAQITDGAAFLILASEAAVKRYELPILGRIVNTAWAALDPALMGLGPVHAIQKLLSSNHLSMQDIDYWEINEAFAVQVLACLKAMQDEEYSQTHFGTKSILGDIPLTKLNVDGGAISIGHPVGASGARLVLHLLHILKRNNAKWGVASLCIGGGQGGAMLIERVSEVINDE